MNVVSDASFKLKWSTFYDWAKPFLQDVRNPREDVKRHATNWFTKYPGYNPNSIQDTFSSLQEEAFKLYQDYTWTEFLRSRAELKVLIDRVQYKVRNLE